jgi:adenylate cyclase
VKGAPINTVLQLKQPVAEVADRPHCANPLVEWLLGDGWNIASPTELVRQLGNRMVDIGIPVYRIRVNIRTLHPQFIGTVYAWQRGVEEVTEMSPTHAVLQEERYLKSPYASIFQGAGGMRRRLENSNAKFDFPILEELRAEGATDYVAMPLVFSDGRINAITLATDRVGGFSTAELETTYAMLPVLARALEVHAMRRTARTILDTYLGKQAGERVLHGLIKRGDGEDIHAVIWFCDLRGSTALADRMPREAYLALLNEFFTCMAGAVVDHGGEVLRFLGDAVIGIFPITATTDHPERCPEHTGACARALAAAQDAMKRMEHLNHIRHEQDEPPLGYGIALHIGDVLYGNIGIPERLDFTVIGPAVNEAARLEAMCRTLERPILISAELARLVPDKLVSLGCHALRGVREPHEIFTLPAFS